MMDADKTRGHYIDPSGGKMLLSALVEGDEGWLKSLEADPSTRQIYDRYWRVHIKPRFGHREIGSIRPSEIRSWVQHLGESLAKSTTRLVLRFLEHLMDSAVDDGLIAKNPCAAKTVTKPKVPKRRIQPWPTERVLSMIDELSERYAIMVPLGAGCGLRQGEIFGLAVDDVDFDEGVIHVRQQVKLIQGQQLFGLPKHDRERTVPLPKSVADALRGYLTQFPAREVTLPWEELTGDPRTLRLVLTSRVPKAFNRNYINKFIWKPALERLGVIAKDRPTRKSTGRANQTTREHGMHALRHYYASVLLDAGESVKALAEYLGHSDPGFTLRTYTHLMPGSDGRTRKVIDAALGLVDRGAGTDPEQAPK